MTRLLTAKELQRELFIGLETICQGTRGHVSIVHTDMWYAVYAYGPIEQGEETFRKVIDEMKNRIQRLWPEPACLHHNSIGKIPKDVYFFTFWLPVPPAKHSADFEAFMPGSGRS